MSVPKYDTRSEARAATGQRQQAGRTPYASRLITRGERRSRASVWTARGLPPLSERPPATRSRREDFHCFSAMRRLRVKSRRTLFAAVRSFARRDFGG